jgi:hypothetical protein
MMSTATPFTDWERPCSSVLCLLPFGAGMLGRYDQEPVALRIYGLLLVAIAGSEPGRAEPTTP